jgi:DNA-binding transcriptional ArsR family regulator
MVSKRTASNDLSELEAHGLLVVEGAGRATRYRLAQSES